MRSWLTIVVLVLQLGKALGQDDYVVPPPLQAPFEKKNSMQVAVGGESASWPTINYERLILNDSYAKLTASAGIPLPLFFLPPYLSFPFSMTGMISLGLVHLEAGVGYTAWYNLIYNYGRTFISFRYGLRFQRSDSKFIFRIGYTPRYFTDDSRVQHTLGLTIGGGF